MVCIGVFLALIYLATPWRQDTSALWPVVKNTLVPTILAGWIVFATNAYKLRTTAFASAAAVLFVVIPTNIFVAYDLITYDGAGQTGFLIVLSIPLIFGLMTNGSCGCLSPGGVYLLFDEVVKQAEFIGNSGS
jgi:hypothetical protein